MPQILNKSSFAQINSYTPSHSPNIYLHSLMRTKFSTVSDDDLSHHHSGINKIVKIYLYTQNTEQVIVHSHTHLIQTLSKILLELKNPKKPVLHNKIHPHSHTPNSKTPTKIKLELKNPKTCTLQQCSAHIHTHQHQKHTHHYLLELKNPKNLHSTTLFSTHSHSPTSKHSHTHTHTCTY